MFNFGINLCKFFKIINKFKSVFYSEAFYSTEIFFLSNYKNKIHYKIIYINNNTFVNKY